MNQASCQWYVRIGGFEDGPFTDEDLKQLKSQGRITPESEIRIAGQSQWIRAGEIDWLFGNDSDRPLVAGLANQPGSQPRVNAVASVADIASTTGSEAVAPQARRVSFRIGGDQFRMLGVLFVAQLVIVVATPLITLIGILAGLGTVGLSGGDTDAALASLSAFAVLMFAVMVISVCIHICIISYARNMAATDRTREEERWSNYLMICLLGWIWFNLLGFILAFVVGWIFFSFIAFVLGGLFYIAAFFPIASLLDRWQRLSRQKVLSGVTWITLILMVAYVGMSFTAYVPELIDSPTGLGVPISVVLSLIQPCFLIAILGTLGYTCMSLSKRIK